MAGLQFNCPTCHAELSVAPGFVGLQAVCPKCNSPLVIPSVGPCVTPPPAAAPPLPPAAERPAGVPPAPDAQDPSAGSAPATVQTASLWSALGRSAAIAKKQTLLEKMRTFDLPAADAAIGSKAYSLHIGRERHASIYQAVEQIEADIATKRTPTDVDPHATIGDRAKHAAVAARTRTQVEALLLTRKRLLGELGKQLREAPPDEPALGPEMAAARQLVAGIATSERDIAELSAGVPRLLRHPFLAAGLALMLLFLLFGGAGSIRSSYERWSLQRQLDAYKAQSQSLADAAKVDEEARQKAKQLAEAERDLKRQKEAGEAAQKRASKAEQKTREEEAKRVEAEETHRREQALRAASIAERLGNLDLSVKVLLSRTLQDRNVRLELREQKLQAINDACSKHDWLRLINVALQREFTEWPDSDSVQRAEDALKNADFTLLLMPQIKLTDEKRLYFIWLPENKGRFQMATSWGTHPDGLGWIHSWKPKDGSVVIILAREERMAKFHALSQAISDQEETLRRKRDLGEIDDDAFRQQMQKYCKEAWDKVLAWAADM